MEGYPTSAMQQFAIAINFFMPCLAMIVLGLRLYTKASPRSLGGPGTFRHPSTLLGPDDLFACLAMIFSICLTVGSYFYIRTNFVGIAPEDIPPEPDFHQGLIWLYVAQIFYFPVLALIKSSFLFFLLRLGGQKPALRLAIHVLNACTLALGFAICTVSVFQCRPVSHYFNRMTTEGVCINQAVFYLVQSGLNILTDFFTLGVPVCIFMHMKMERRMKIVTLYVFLLGFIVTIIGIIRFVFLYMLFYSDVRTIPNYSMSFCLSAVETNLAIICACAPTLRGLVRSWFPSSRRTLSKIFFSPNKDDDGNPIISETSKTNTSTAAAATSAGAAGIGGTEKDREVVREKKNMTMAEFGYPKDGRGRVLCSHAGVEGLGLTPSEEDIMRSNGILRRTDVVVEHGDERSLTRSESVEDPMRGRGSMDSDGSDTGSR
ncbi:hypothetical protein QBC47DRAFT_225254 [Echria macrotheca]|uniref:Rhodopsin domain-containing protein n=1 Tax=Echria macrotheca TaxID=438768 RepID=A0AAJ0BBF0_9PEZI|nr:hypothetical protein QBC47DRAFT_225254 [Echria macrotheca]